MPVLLPVRRQAAQALLWLPGLLRERSAQEQEPVQERLQVQVQRQVSELLPQVQGPAAVQGQQTQVMQVQGQMRQPVPQMLPVSQVPRWRLSPLSEEPERSLRPEARLRGSRPS